MPVLLGILGLAVFVEDLLGLSGSLRDRVNRPALAVVALALLALPLLLQLIASRPPSDHAWNNWAHVTRLNQFTGGLPTSLIRHLANDPAAWLASDTVGRWGRAVITISLGLAWLRPHLLLLGLPLSLVSWLLRDDPLWPPRLAASLSFSWCLAVLGFASVWRLVLAAWRSAVSADRAPDARMLARLVALVIAIGLLAGSAYPGFKDQLARLPNARAVYEGVSGAPYSADERRLADQLFAVYRERSAPGEPVVASNHLFRYAHDRNLFWLDRLGGRPRPHWILADRTYRGHGAWGLVDSDYDLVSSAGQFVLYRKQK
jgi:hypothetical protein